MLRDKAQDVAVVRRNRIPECGMQLSVAGKCNVHLASRPSEIRAAIARRLRSPPRPIESSGNPGEDIAGERWLITRTCYAVVAPSVSRKLSCGDGRRHVLQ